MSSDTYGEPNNILQHDAAAANIHLTRNIKELKNEIKTLEKRIGAAFEVNKAKDAEICRLNAKIRRGIMSYGRDWDERPPPWRRASVSDGFIVPKNLSLTGRRPGKRTSSAMVTPRKPVSMLTERPVKLVI